MKKHIYLFLTLICLTIFSCGNKKHAEFSPEGPLPNDDYMPQNRPTGPEGSGQMGQILNDR